MNSSASSTTLQTEWTKDASQRIITESTTPKRRVRQLTTDNRTLEERLTAIRNVRFEDRHAADLEARVPAPAGAN
ncbi:hypothetical protein ACFQ1S_22375 [Kibdelosporangium lantanae]|uniref:Transposase n=1 Tax=Kibdelosporangium lantanae TaxID=1497396 RepID=A0ABW3MCP9_9PSEU